MKKIKVMVDDLGYVTSYCDYGYNADNYIEVDLDDNFFDIYKTYKNDEVIEEKYEVNDLFSSNYKYLKLENGALFFDESKKLAEEKEKKQQEIEELQNQIIDLEIKKSMYVARKWSTVKIDEEIKNLEDKMLLLME